MAVHWSEEGLRTLQVEVWLYLDKLLLGLC